jgi:hypothetical protein
MFANLKSKFGWNMYRTTFKTAIEDGINWDSLGANPSALRTNYVAAYLQLGAPEDIAPFLEGIVPKFDPAVLKDILRARSAWTSLPPDSAQRTFLRAAYLKGDYAACLPGDPSKTKLFKEMSVWTNEKITLTVLKVNGETFGARFVMEGDNIDREIKGTIKDGKVSWLAKDVHALRGNEGGDNFGTIATDNIGPRIDFVRREKNGDYGSYTLRLSEGK